MTQHVSVTLVCDLHDENDEIEAVCSREIGLDGETITADLCDPHDRQVAGLFSELAARGRAVRTRKSQSRRKRTTVQQNKNRNREIRAWARNKGYVVSQSWPYLGRSGRRVRRCATGNSRSVETREAPIPVPAR